MWLFEHLVAHISLSIVSPFIVRLFYTQIQNIKEFKPPLSLKPSTFVIGGSSISCIIPEHEFPACHLDKSHQFSNCVVIITKNHNYGQITLLIMRDEIYHLGDPCPSLYTLEGQGYKENILFGITISSCSLAVHADQCCAPHALILWVGPPLMVRPMSCPVDTRGHTPIDRADTFITNCKCHG